MVQPAFPYQAAEVIAKYAPHAKPKIGFVLGSGLSSLADDIVDPISISYDELPGFPEIKVKGHSGELIIGKLNGTEVVCLKGRAHPYEGHGHEATKTYIRTLKLLGCEIYFAGNASGSFKQENKPGSLIMINDHINFQPTNPLVGPNDDDFGTRFPPMDNAYDPELRNQLKACANELDIELNEGTYISVIGPCYETPAEIRMYRTLGAEVIGMSTVPEVLVARHCGLKVAVIATITNYVTDMAGESHNHDNVVKVANEAALKLRKLVAQFAGTLSD